ncbi:hypothetical protein SCP_1004620 [Sparassis crispa]|uniref:Fe2OG dioxygenase domain-containing protein n=1 Tax=Sparassis crispa TaxID=139825 RepID=A0A401GYB0_9APHY|nr:hypothetical protein SCP_1004620 [Sparassis crispa]GBE87215.1 hypothetical protein SCP_1004620 [Sparassis crispa]
MLTVKNMSTDIVEKQLESLGSLITQKPPLCSGTLQLPYEQFILFYGKEGDARRVNLSSASDEALAHLAQTCHAATFGVHQRDVLDESYRKTGKLDLADFAMQFDAARTGLVDVVQTELLEAQRPRAVHAEPYKLKVYSPSAFFKSHVDTPRSEAMFGSLVVVFPTRHEGGSLVLRHDAKEWPLDFARILAEQSGPSRALLGPAARGLGVQSLTSSESQFKERFRALLDAPVFLPRGGHLGFGLRHKYPLNTDFSRGFHSDEDEDTDLDEDMYEGTDEDPNANVDAGANQEVVRASVDNTKSEEEPDNTESEEEPADQKVSLQHLLAYLKGSDAALLHACRELSLRVSVRLLYKGHKADTLADRVLDLTEGAMDDPLWCNVRYHGGKLLSDTENVRRDMEVRWVTTPPKENLLSSPFVAYGNEASIGYAYMYLCLLVDVGKAGKRATA